MTITLAPAYTQRTMPWTTWKALLALKSGAHQYEEEPSLYTVWFYDGPDANICYLWKGEVPFDVLASGYTQQQNDLDLADFEANYKASANCRNRSNAVLVLPQTTGSLDAKGRQTADNSIPVVTASDVPTWVILDGGASSKPLEVSYETSKQVSTGQVGYWFEGTTYTVPSGFKFNIIQVIGWTENQNPTWTFRVSRKQILGSYTFGGSFTVVSPYQAPQYAANIRAQVTTTLQTGSSYTDVVLTVTYTNQSGVGGRVTSVTIPRGTLAGVKVTIPKVEGDSGVQAITNVTKSGNNTGAVALNGAIDVWFFYGGNGGGGSLNSVFAKDSLVIRAGETITLDHSCLSKNTAARGIKVIGVLEPV